MGVADFNNDGQTDLAILSEDYASIVINDGGSLQRIKNFVHPSFYAPSFVEPGDHNGDGLVDVFMPYNVDSIAVLTNLGDGEFEFTHKYWTGPGIATLRAGDFNGDSRTDLAVLSWFEQKVMIFINSEQGFLAPVSYSAGTGVAIVSGYFNNDAHLDLAVANVDEHSIGLMINAGDGTFQISEFASENQYPGGLHASDLDQDGLDDLIVSYFDKKPSFYQNTGAGFQLQSWAVSTGSGSSGRTLTTGDINNDSYPDVVTTDWDGYVIRTYVNNKNGTFSPEVSYDTGPQPHDPIVGDFNNDGKNEVVVLALSSIEVFFNKGDGTFNSKHDFGPGYPLSIVAADFNKDGLDDIASVNHHNNFISVSLNTGDGIFATQENYVTGMMPSYVTSYDLNGDDNLDLIVANSSDSAISVLQGVGDGSFLVARNYRVGKYPFYVSIADMDNDGGPDIVTTNGEDHTVSVLIHSTGIDFKPRVDLKFGFRPARVVAGDLNNDGLADLAIAGSYPSFGLFRYLNSGGLTFGPPVSIDPDNGPTADIKFLDITGDGKTDIVTAKNSSINVYAGDGNGSFATRISYSQGYECHNISIGDFNGDGNIDIATTAYGNFGVYVLRGDGSHGFSDYSMFARPEAPLDMVAGNFDGNEKTDLAIGGWPRNSLAIMLSLPVLKVTAKDTTRFYGYDNPQFKSTVEGLKGLDQITVTFKTPATHFSYPDEYEIEPVPDAFAHENYALIIEKGVLTVTKAPLKVTVDDKIRMYSFPNPTFTGVVEGIRNNDSYYVEYYTEADEDSPVGEYPIMANVGFVESLYTLEVINGVLSVVSVVGTESPQDVSVTIYPNPSDGQFLVGAMGNAHPLSYVIQDYTGRAVASGMLESGSNLISMNTPAGLYLMRFSDGSVKKIIVR